MGAWRKIRGLIITASLAVAIFVAGTAAHSSVAKSPRKGKPNLIEGAFVPFGQRMSSSRYDAMTVALPDGRVLIAGGTTGQSKSPPVETDTVDLFDPNTGELEAAGHLAGPRGAGQAVAMSDGRVVLIGGGFCCWGNTPFAEVYDPGRGESQPLDLAKPIPKSSSVVRLPQDRILVVGGSGESGFSAAILDPATGDVMDLDPMPVPRRDGLTATLPDGRILIYGGLGEDGEPQMGTVFFDPSNGTFSLGPRQIVPRRDPATVVLGDGRVLVAGGIPSNGGALLRSAEIFDPRRDAFEETGDLTIGRAWGNAVELSDGRVLVTGGTNVRADLYDPATGTFTRTGDLAKPRLSASLVALPDGRALILGGVYVDEDGYSVGRSTAEVFEPTEFNPHVRVVAFRPRNRVVRINRKFRVRLRLRNDGKGTARSFRVCVRVDRWRFRQMSCPVVRNLKPRTTRWATFAGTYGGGTGSTGKRRLEFAIDGQGVHFTAKVSLRVRPARIFRPGPGR